jgi:hypothetical protein
MRWLKLFKSRDQATFRLACSSYFNEAALYKFIC